MSLLTHFLAADARRLRLAIALWVTAAVVQAGVQHARSFFEPFTPEGQTVAMVAGLMWFAGLLLSCALVAWVIQLHPAVGSDAFWMTRPIPLRTLVMAKLVLLTAVFVGLPLVIEQVAMAAHRMPPADMARVAIQTVLLRGLLLAVLAVAAALTPNFARFTLLCGAVLFGLAMLPVILITIERLTRDEGTTTLSAFLTSGSGIAIPFPGADDTALLVATALLLAGGLAAMAVQYRGRRVRHSLLVIAGVLALTVLTTMNWPWEWLQARVSAPEWAESPTALQLSADAAAIRFDPPPGWHAGLPRWVARVPVRMTPAAPGWLATARLLDASLELRKDERFSSRTGGSPFALAGPDGRRHAQLALQHVLGVQRLSGGDLIGVRDDEPGVMLQLPADALSRTNVPTAAFRGGFLVDLTRLEAAAVLPLAAGATYQDGAYRITFREVRTTNFAAALFGRAANVTTMLDRRPRPGYSYFLRNRSRSEAVQGSASDAGAAASFSLVGGLHMWGGAWTGFSAGALMSTFHARYVDREPEFVIDREWLDQAELVIVRATHDGAVRRTLEVRDFPLKAGS